MTEVLFDEFSEDYDAALAEGLSVSGEDKLFFARGRVAWLADCLNKLGVHPSSVVDFGCGIGSATPYLFDLLGADSVLGVDISEKCLQVAQDSWGSDRARFERLNKDRPTAAVDLVFCNGVFHHIKPTKRSEAFGSIHRSLKPGGLFALWENNPWNPGTRYIMSRCPFDRDAITITPPECRRMLNTEGFEVLSTSFLFIFPRALKWLRGIEPLVSRLPLGAQYQVLCRKS